MNKKENKIKNKKFNCRGEIQITIIGILVILLMSITFSPFFTLYFLIFQYNQFKDIRYYGKYVDEILNYIVYLSLFLSYICIYSINKYYEFDCGKPKNKIEKYKNKFSSKNCNKMIFLIFITMFENISLIILKNNNFYGIIYKDFNCENKNYLQFFNDSKSDIKCKKNKLNYNFTKDEYPNKWIYKLDDKTDYKKLYCQEFIDSEKFIYHGKSKYQNYPLVKNDFKNKNHFFVGKYENEFYGKNRNEVLITQKKIYIKNKEEAERCIPSKYIKNNYIVINITGISYGHVKCKRNFLDSNIIKYNYTNIYKNPLKINYGYAQPEDWYFIMSIVYTITYCVIYQIVIYVTLKYTEKKNINLFQDLINQNKSKDIEKIFDKKLKIFKLLFKIVWFLLFYFYDSIVNYLCDLNDGKLECYINDNTINTFLGYLDLRPNKCEGNHLYADFYNIETIIQYIYMIPILIFFVVMFFVAIFNKDDIPFNDNKDCMKIFCYHWLGQFLISCFFNMCFLWGSFMYLLVFGGIGSIILLLFLIINNLSVVYYFFITIANPSYWSMFKIKIPSFESFHINLGVIFNKNIYFCIKCLYFMMMIYDDLKGIYSYNCNKKEKNKSIEIELNQVQVEIKENIENN